MLFDTHRKETSYCVTIFNPVDTTNSLIVACYIGVLKISLVFWLYKIFIAGSSEYWGPVKMRWRCFDITLTRTPLTDHQKFVIGHDPEPAQSTAVPCNLSP
jgi:hypothetical protein